MSDLIATHYGITPMTPETIDRVSQYESELAKLPQVDMPTHHVIHGGMYARTIRIPAGVDITGAQIKLATIVIVNGHVLVAVEGGTLELEGYHVLPAAKGRKQAFRAIADTDVTMIFPTQSTTVEACEWGFTDDADRLMSRQCENTVVITGE